MPPPLVYCHHMSYPSWVYKRCSDTLLKPYLQPCTSQLHQKTLYISTGTCILTSWLKTNSFYYWLIYPYIEPTRSQCTRSLLWIFPTKITQPTMTWTPDTLESPRMQQWELNSTTQFQICQQANGQFCHISTPFQLLANPPMCIAALYTKSKTGIASKCSLQLPKMTTTNLPTQITPDVWILTTLATAPINTVTLICPEKPMETLPIQQLIHILKLPMACSATSSHFYLPPRYETPISDVNVSLNMANLQMINISAQHFCIWQHLGNNRSDMQLQHLATIPSIPVHKVYQHLLNSTMPLVPFNTESSDGTDSLWSVFTHPGIYISALGLIIPVGIGLFCCYFFWCWPARLACQPLQPGNMQYTIVDDNVEVAPIYRYDGKATQPTRPCKNHGLAIEHLPTWTESHCKQQSKSFAVPVQGSLGKSPKIQGTQECT